MCSERVWPFEYLVLIFLCVVWHKYQYLTVRISIVGLVRFAIACRLRRRRRRRPSNSRLHRLLLLQLRMAQIDLIVRLIVAGHGRDDRRVCRTAASDVVQLLRNGRQRFVCVTSAAAASAAAASTAAAGAATHRQAATERSALGDFVQCTADAMAGDHIEAAVVGRFAHLGRQRWRHIVVIGRRRIGGHCAPTENIALTRTILVCNLFDYSPTELRLLLSPDSECVSPEWISMLWTLDVGVIVLVGRDWRRSRSTSDRSGRCGVSWIVWNG